MALLQVYLHYMVTAVVTCMWTGTWLFVEGRKLIIPHWWEWVKNMSSPALYCGSENKALDSNVHYFESHI